ncbi:DUF6334 family protein [Anaerolineales bacterium HSG6]|nr:DUF6334 family protein [Anaerolineales bacterium HSG6]
MVENNEEFPMGYYLSGVSIIEYTESGGDDLELDEINLLFNEVQHMVTLKPISATDEVEIIHQAIPTPAPMMNTPDWMQPFVGKMLDMVWVCDNQQGYQDLVIFAFQYLQPNIGFLAEGSVLKVVQHEMVQRTPTIQTGPKETTPKQHPE